MFKEFKDFAMKGNLIDIAVGLVMATAFGKIVSAFVDGMFMPIVGKLLGNVDFSKMEYTLQKGSSAIDEVKDASGAVVTPAIAAVADVTIKYGAFITTVLDFIIVAFVMFMIIKAMNASKKKEEAAPSAPPAPSKEETLLTEIRDLLKK
jgi:large conductance mechanosensitive channel